MKQYGSRLSDKMFLPAMAYYGGSANVHRNLRSAMNTFSSAYRSAACLPIRSRSAPGIHVIGADRYRNPDEDVPKDFDSQCEAYYEALELPCDSKTFISGLRDRMREALQTFNDGLPRNPGVRITNKAGG